MSYRLYVFVGTIAEFIKLFPIMKKLKEKNLDYTIIASGQNNIRDSDLFAYLENPKIIHISQKKPKQSVSGLLFWFLKTFFLGIKTSRKLKEQKGDIILIVHGDTVSTLLGAVLGKLFGFKILHVEAGLRSFNIFRPFPEEICRVMTSMFADVGFCPNEWAMNNLSKFRRMKKVNTFFNTLVESTHFALKIKMPKDYQEIREKIPGEYFIFVTHRQENIYNKSLMQKLTDKVLEISNRISCLFVLHKPTEEAFRRYNLLQKIQSHKNIFIVSRLPYITFTKLIASSSFIITDGGSNQEEAYFLGKPCLILRKETERIEGLGENVVLSKLEISKIDWFIEKWKSLSKDHINYNISPSEIIVNYIIDSFL